MVALDGLRLRLVALLALLLVIVLGRGPFSLVVGIVLLITHAGLSFCLPISGRTLRVTWGKSRARAGARDRSNGLHPRRRWGTMPLQGVRGRSEMGLSPLRRLHSRVL